MSPIPVNEVSDKTGIKLVCGIDEQWSYIDNKSQRRWLWYTLLPHFKRVFAYDLASHADATLKTLLNRVNKFSFRLFCTDHWGFL